MAKGPTFSDAAASRKGCAVIVAGSDSDRQHVEKIIESLEEFRIPYEVRICSAHKEPARLLELIAEYERLEGAVAYIAVAGGADALSGVLSFNALAPVISCPPDAPNASCLANPPGSSNAVIYNPKNIGRFVAQIFAAYNERFREALRETRERKIEELGAKDRELREKFRRSARWEA